MPDISVNTASGSESATPLPNANANPAANPTPPAATPPRTFKVKVEGSEREVSEPDMIRDYQLAQVSQKRLQEASAERKKADDQFSRLKTNPWEVMSELGLNPREIAEHYLAEQIQAELMSPEEKIRQEEMKELEQFRGERKTQQEQQKAQQLQQLTAHHHQSLTQEFIKELSTAKLPKNEATVRRVAETMLNASRNGYEMTVGEAVGIVNGSMRQDVSSLIGDLEPEQLMEIIGEGSLKKLRDFQLAQVKNPIPQRQQPAATKEDKPKYSNADEYFAAIRKKNGLS